MIHKDAPIHFENAAMNLIDIFHLSGCLTYQIVLVTLKVARDLGNRPVRVVIPCE